jgi:nicotinate-nucleotide pyrophosphorylase (carboxylating)
MSPMLSPLPDLLIDPVVRAALAEDLGRAGDVTASACLPADARMSVVFAARQPGRIAGLDCARLAIAAMDPQARFETVTPDGADVEAGAVLARVEGGARALLSAERVALNLFGRLSGVATLTRAYVGAVHGPRPASSARAKPRLACAPWKNTPCAAGAESTTASAWMTPS